MTFHVEIADTPVSLIATIAAPVAVFSLCELVLAGVGIMRDLARLRLGLPIASGVIRAEGSEE